MKNKVIVARNVLGLLVLSVLGACSNSSSSGSSSSSGGGTSLDGDASLTIGVTDSPIDEASRVIIEFNGVTLKGVGDGSPSIVIEFNQPKVIDLLSLQGSNSQLLLDAAPVPSGDYQWIRLQVTADGIYTPPAAGDFDGHGVGSYLERDNGSGGTEKIPLKVPSGSQSGLKLVGNFTASDKGETAFTIDFDLRQMINGPFLPGASEYYELLPEMRMIDTEAGGHISGFIDPSLLEDNVGCLGSQPEDLEGVSVYVFYAMAIVDDIQSNSGPITTALVSYENDAYKYAFGFMEAGEYKLALSCDAELDNSNQNDDIVFLSEIDQVFVEAGLTTQVDITN